MDPGTARESARRVAEYANLTWDARLIQALLPVLHSNLVVGALRRLGRPTVRHLDGKNNVNLNEESYKANLELCRYHVGNTAELEGEDAEIAQPRFLI